MKIGYPCINRSIGCTANATFRLKNYSEENLVEKVKNNLDCLMQILKYNKQKNLLFFRISSVIVPFGSHPICKFDWQKYFKNEFKTIGNYIKENNFRISMHPDQFTLINAKDEFIVKRSIAELNYHCEILDLMSLDNTAKIQIHVGGVYGDKEAAITRFIHNYNLLPEKIKKRLVVENDDFSYSLKDCLRIHRACGIPILFDTFHHECLNNNESIHDALLYTKSTWKKEDGEMMVDYSTQKQEARRGTHTEHIDINHFKKFLETAKNINFDIMLEIKDKEKSALEAKKEIEC